jgi:ABC-type uncharacterized transport system auxiliary subunit
MTSVRVLILACCAACLSGCNFLHELQPHRLWRLNRHPAPSSASYYSVSDPVPDLDEHVHVRTTRAVESKTEFPK